MSAPLRDGSKRFEGWKLNLPTCMEWAKPEFSRNQVDKAGQVIIQALPEWSSPEWNKSFDEYKHAVQVINNWRSAHSYPLNNFQNNLRNRARLFSEKPLVSQRLKRFESIVKKLMRDQTSTLELSQMQDIGGCRAVLNSTPEVYALAKSYLEKKKKKFAHELVGIGKDYLKSPKPDGYRSVHLIFKWKGPETNKAWDKLRIEMQLRSLHQHSWATALEAVDIFTSQALKANNGDERWQRFFALMASAIAIREKCPLVPGTPEKKSELRSELGHLATELDVIQVLHGYRTGIQAIHSQASKKNAAYYLLHLSFNKRNISWIAYDWFESQEANAKYTELEQEYIDRVGEYVVLVKAGSFAAIKRSYPSFFLDTGRFNDLLVEALGPRGLDPKAAGL